MILEPKAKPVKFRIRSGGEEHSSLDSLRKNFVWEDIRPLCGNGKQLDKWLERIDADVAKHYKENPTDNLLGVYNVLFRKKDDALLSNADVFNKIEALIGDNRQVEDNDKTDLKSLKVLCKSLISELSFKDLKRYVAAYKSLYDFFEPELILRVQRTHGALDANDLFALGKIVFDSERNNELAQKWISMASSKGLKDASAFFENNVKEARELRRKRILNLVSTDKIKIRLKKSWTDKEAISDISDYDKDEQNILSLSNVCLEIFKMTHDGDDISDEYKKKTYQYAEEKLKSVLSDDILYEEKMFVMAIIDFDAERARRRLEIINYYPPAMRLLQDDQYFVAEGRRFKIGYIFSNSHQFDFWIRNLYRFGYEDGFQKMLSSVTRNGHEVEVNELDRLLSDMSVTNRISQAWISKVYIMPRNDFDLKDKLFDFSDKCLKIFNLINAPKLIGDIALADEVSKIMGETLLLNTDPFYMEKVFIMGLFAKNFDLARKDMKTIEWFYPAAYHIANDETHTLSIEGNVYSICDGWRRKNANGLEYFIKNLPKFRKNVRFYK